MKKLIMLLCTACLPRGCTCSQETIQYNVAKNYFFSNNASLPASLKVTNEHEFNHYFGMAAVMGKGGEPTKIDFKKQFVIAKVLPETNISTDIQPLSLVQKGNTLLLNYKVIRGKKQSYYTQPFFILVVNRKYIDKEVIENNASKE